MLTRPRNIIMSENRVKPVRHYSVRKREAREFHGSGLISNHVNFAYGCVFRRICRPVLLRAL